MSTTHPKYKTCPICSVQYEVVNGLIFNNDPEHKICDTCHDKKSKTTNNTGDINGR